MYTIFLSFLLTFMLVGCGGDNSSSPSDINTTEEYDINTTEEQLDTLAPTVTLVGESSMTLTQGELYIEYGAIASDNVDGDLKVNIEGTLNTQKSGTYTLRYSAEDTAGNEGLAYRTLTITPKQECEAKYSEELMQGRNLYNETCKVCHAGDAKSGLFDIRNSSVKDIDTAMVEVVDMVELNLDAQVSQEQRELISHFLVEISKDPEVEFGNVCQEDSQELKRNLGARLFFDANLSLRRSMSCSSCHNPGHAFIDARHTLPDNNNPVNGALSVGDDDSTLGGRNAPTVMYAQFIPAFNQNAKGEYFGGQFHDGRAATLKDQAKGPFLDQAEMMMPDATTVISRVQENSSYVADMKIIFGENIFDNPDQAYDGVAEAIASFEQTSLFAPFSSKYDRSKLDINDSNYYMMSEQEQKGYELFFDTTKTNCVLCHSINSQIESPKELFTNFKYENIGTPKNNEALILRDGNTDKIDLQLGGRSDINSSDWYGRTKVPTLRNIAVTGPYMSNGVFNDLATVLKFYNHMGDSTILTVNPETGKVWKSPEIDTSVNFELLKMDSLSDEEVDELEAFLKLLTDKQYEALL